VQQEDVNQFRTHLRGQLIGPTDPGYEEARKVYNAMISKKPRLIAFCADVADVMAAVQFGKQQDLKVSIRSGGHNAGGLGICDDGPTKSVTDTRLSTMRNRPSNRVRFNACQAGRKRVPS